MMLRAVLYGLLSSRAASLSSMICRPRASASARARCTWAVFFASQQVLSRQLSSPASVVSENRSSSARVRLGQALHGPAVRIRPGSSVSNTAVLIVVLSLRCSSSDTLRNGAGTGLPSDPRVSMPLTIFTALACSSPGYFATSSPVLSISVPSYIASRLSGVRSSSFMRLRT